MRSFSPGEAHASLYVEQLKALLLERLSDMYPEYKIESIDRGRGFLGWKCVSQLTLTLSSNGNPPFARIEHCEQLLLMNDEELRAAINLEIARCRFTGLLPSLIA